LSTSLELFLGNISIPKHLACPEIVAKNKLTPITAVSALPVSLVGIL